MENKLHIGCGQHILAGWLNVDIEAEDERIEYLDATKTFPYSDAMFDFVFSEHMIEHVPYKGGLNMLAESYRVLKPGGRIRISTPDLEFLIALRRPFLTPSQRAYLNWAVEAFTPGMPHDSTFLINNFMRAWGHTFIYDGRTLINAMVTAGFTDITGRELQESAFEEFRNIEDEGRMPPGFLRLETMTYEGKKP